MPKGYVFDMDGTLIDSMPMLEGVDKSFVESVKIPFTDELADKLKYIPISEAAKYVAETFNTKYTADEMEKILLDTVRQGYTTVKLKDGVREYLNFCRNRGIKMCIATATLASSATEVAERLGLMEYMDFLVSCSDVGVSKDKPDVFLEAARRMCLAPCDVTVFEDGLPGAKSAKSVGFNVIAVYDSSVTETESAEMKKISDRYITSFTELKDTVV